MNITCLKQGVGDTLLTIVSLPNDDKMLSMLVEILGPCMFHNNNIPTLSPLPPSQQL